MLLIPRAFGHVHESANHSLLEHFQFRRIPRLYVTTIVSLALLFSLSAAAGQLFPCPKAAISKTGSFLVIIDRQPHGQTVLQIVERELFINDKDRMISHETFWKDWVRWSVVLDPVPDCPVPLITDDGEFVVVLKAGLGVNHHKVLRIYRRRDHIGDLMREGPDHGVLIEEISLEELWPKDKVQSGVTWNDSSPQWFAGGSFEFSWDLRELIHTSRWGNAVRIDLANGSVTPMK
jgi:hypothetical protein